jgi:hypothetical protein
VSTVVSTTVPASTGLDASVSLGPVGEELLDELPSLYGSLFSTAAWFTAEDLKVPAGVCILDDPRHVIVFCHDHDTVDVLNKAFPIAPHDVCRAARAIFRAMPWIRRIHVEVLFDARELRVPKRVLAAADDLVVELADCGGEYAASLGKRTRKNLRNFENRLRRGHPDAETRIFIPSPDELPALAEQMVDWNIARLQARGIKSSFAGRPDKRARLRHLLSLARAEAHLTTIGGRPAAVEFVVCVGSEATVYAGAFDLAYQEEHLGFLSTYWAVREVARRGYRRCHLLWTTGDYKERLGATPQTATQLSLFRTPASRLWSLDEARIVHSRDFRKAARRRYWEARHAARGAAERAGLLSPFEDAGGET